MYVFHVLNAYDEGDSIVMDVVRLPVGVRHPSRRGASPPTTRSSCGGRVDPAAGKVTEEQLDDVSVEFPRIDDAVAGRPHRYGYCTSIDMIRPDRRTGLVKYDLRPAMPRWPSTRVEHRSAGEPVFVRAADGHGEDEGWVLATVYDATRDASDLVILDATSFAGPPVATVHLPARVPFGFHGSWLPSIA